MRYAVGDAVRLKDGSDRDELLGPAADLTGQVGAAWTDERGERVCVWYDAASVYAMDMPAEAFTPDRPLDASPF